MMNVVAHTKRDDVLLVLFLAGIAAFGLWAITGGRQ